MPMASDKYSYTSVCTCIIVCAAFVLTQLTK